MSEPSISVRGLAKRYRIGARQEPYQRLTEVVTEALTAPLRRLRQLTAAPRQDELIWALQDVSFDVEPGEVMGIIGRNGAGKSTLLKILSRITEPTRGEAVLRGRVGSLLEVGTGFHPELTGRENIFLNGVILGMSRREIRRKFDAIVDFAEIETFVDTPIKRYSSGMYVRLAFAVAAHLEQEILLVDEVLAAGDLAFQQKCLNKMDSVSRSGRTILLVSHNMSAVERLASRCLLLEEGELRSCGKTHEVLEIYFAQIRADRLGGARALERYRRASDGEGDVMITACGLQQAEEDLPRVAMGAPLTLLLELRSERSHGPATVTCTLKNTRGESVVLLYSPDTDLCLELEPGTQRLRLTIEDLWLPPGTYAVDVAIRRGPHGAAHDALCDLPLFEIENRGEVRDWPDRPWGAVHHPRASWERD